MAILNNPIILEITRAGGRLNTIEVMPLYREEGNAFVATNALRLYEGYPPENSNCPDAESQRERYLDDIELLGENNPGYLGEIHFQDANGEQWRYKGDRLNALELQQIAGLILDYAWFDPFSEEEAIDLILNEHKETVVPLTFAYTNGYTTDIIRIEEMEGHFIIFINEELSAQVEMPEDEWEVTGGDIFNTDLLREIFGRIQANT